MPYSLRYCLLYLSPGPYDRSPYSLPYYQLYFSPRPQNRRSYSLRHYLLYSSPGPHDKRPYSLRHCSFDCCQALYLLQDAFSVWLLSKSSRYAILIGRIVSFVELRFFCLLKALFLRKKDQRSDEINVREEIQH